MCGIVGLISLSENNIFFELFEALYHLQHRGQDSYGLSIFSKSNNLTSKTDKFITNSQKVGKQTTNIIKNKGLLLNSEIKNIDGHIGIGHVRYPTTGANTIKEAQPFIKQGIFHTIVLVHNGQIWKTNKVIEYFKIHKLQYEVKTDTELIINLLSFEFNKYKVLNNSIIINIIKHITNLLEGSFSCICMILNYGMVVFKDIRGIRPLIFGHKDDNYYLVSSESVSLTCLDYKIVNDIYNEIIIFKNDIPGYSIYKNDTKKFSPCIFEWIYLARVESILYNVPVYLARMKMGESLVTKIQKEIKKDELNAIDYIIPVPDTSKPAALAIANCLKIPYIEAIVKNRYINRTFIMDTQNKRKKNIKRKLNVVQSFIKNKNIMIVDDSIVRGNTIKHIINLLKKNEAKQIYIVSCSPRILYENKYGIDIPNKNELIAYKMSIKEMEQFYGVKKIIFHDLGLIIKSIQEFNPNILQFETSVFIGY